MTSTLATINSSVLGNVAGGASAGPRRNVAQNGGTGYFDHSYGFGIAAPPTWPRVVSPDGFGRRAAEAVGERVNVWSY
jgi:hypothetical protein